MAKVVGVGGVFVRAHDVAQLTQWYARVLGIDLNLEAGAIFDRSLGSDYVVLSFFDQANTYIGDPQRQSVMINYVVDDLDGLLAHLRECGVDHETIQTQPYGRFSWTTDPEGNRIELWEPSAAETDD